MSKATLLITLFLVFAISVEVSHGWGFRFRIPRFRFPRIRLPRIRFPRIRFPRIRLPRIRLPRIRLPRLHKIVKPILGTAAKVFLPGMHTAITAGCGYHKNGVKGVLGPLAKQYIPGIHKGITKGCKIHKKLGRDVSTVDDLVTRDDVVGDDTDHIEDEEYVQHLTDMVDTKRDETFDPEAFLTMMVTLNGDPELIDEY